MQYGQFLRGWAQNLSDVYKEEKERLTLLIDELDLKAKTVTLSEARRAHKRESDIAIAKLWRDEETKWAQHAKVNHIQEDGNNTKYFHLIANGKHRKTRIFQLEQDEGTIVGQYNLKAFITEYYKKLFGATEINHFSMREEFRWYYSVI
jgi:hypothetical protein